MSLHSSLHHTNIPTWSSLGYPNDAFIMRVLPYNIIFQKLSWKYAPIHMLKISSGIRHSIHTHYPIQRYTVSSIKWRKCILSNEVIVYRVMMYANPLPIV